MAWSLLNMQLADKVEELLKTQDDSYGPEVSRAVSRDKARAVIHAAIWAYSARADSTASAYAFLNLMEALGIKAWSFDEEDRQLLSQAHSERIRASREKDALTPQI